MTDGTRSPDILIVGGGLIGCAAAWHLRRHGLDVVLAEQRHINAGASGQNAGSLHFQIERRFLEQGERQARDAARIVNLNRLAITEWADLEEQLGRPLDIAMHGGIMVAETAAELDLLARKTALENELGLPTEMLNQAQLRERAPCLSDQLVGAAWLGDEGHANPRILSAAYAQEAADLGARILTGTAVRKLVPLKGKDGARAYCAHLSGPDGETTVTAGRVLLATGHWSASLATTLGINIPLYPAPLMMSVTDRTSQRLPFLIQHVGQRLSMKQTEDGNFLVGGGWPSLLAHGADGRPDFETPPTLDMAGLRANLAVAARVMPELARRSLIRSWTGTTCISADHMPIVGEVLPARGLYVAAGGSMFTLGPLLARLLSDMIATGTQPEELAMFTPDRFVHLNAFSVMP